MADDLVTMITALIALISAIIAWLENRKKNAVITVMSDPTVLQGNDRIKALSLLPERSYLMAPETRRWLLAGESPEDQALIAKQIDQAELGHQLTYQILYSVGGYQIEYGMPKNSWVTGKR